MRCSAGSWQPLARGSGVSVAEMTAQLKFLHLSERAIVNRCAVEAHWCATRCFKHATPDYLVRITNLFSLRLSNEKNDSSQQNNSRRV